MNRSHSYMGPRCRESSPGGGGAHSPTLKIRFLILISCKQNAKLVYFCLLNDFHHGFLFARIARAHQCYMSMQPSNGKDWQRGPVELFCERQWSQFTI